MADKVSKSHTMKLIEQAFDITSINSIEAESLGFMGRNLIQATMPHSKIEDTQFTRINGNFQLSIISDKNIGIPYGIYPRVILCWLSTEVVTKKSRDIILGNSFNEFMKNVGIIPTGGRWGTISRFRDQVKRLFSASISCTYFNEDKWMRKSLHIADESVLWWNSINPKQNTLFSSTVKLSENFFEDLKNHPVPVDLRIVKLLKHSSFALDLYFWLTYRVSYLHKETHIPFNSLMLQFGTGYNNDKRGRYEFKKSFKHQLKKIQVLWPQLKIYIDDENNCFVLKPSPTNITRIKY